MSFKYFGFIQSAKFIFRFRRIQIWKNIWRARTSARAERARKSKKMLFLMIFCSNTGNFCAPSARGSARAPEISINSNSLKKIDDFCTKNECKIVKTRF